jgi:hypothetical protein
MDSRLLTSAREHAIIHAGPRVPSALPGSGSDPARVLRDFPACPPLELHMPEMIRIVASDVALLALVGCADRAPAGQSRPEEQSLNEAGVSAQASAYALPRRGSRVGCG